MIPLSCVAYFNWDKEAGDRLRELRGGISRRELSRKMGEQGHQCSQQYIQKLEDGKAQSVDKAVIVGLCQVLDSNLSQIIPTLLVSSPQ